MVVLSRVAPVLWCLLLFSTYSVDGFQPASTPRAATIRQRHLHVPSQRFSQGDDDKDNQHDKASREKPGSATARGRFFPGFWSRWGQNKESEENIESSVPAVDNPATVAMLSNEPSSASSASRPEHSAVERAALLKAHAEKARLEAERMDAELTLQKIERLERELKHAKSKGKGGAVEKLQRDMDALQAKLLGQPPPALVVAKKPAPSKSSSKNDTRSTSKSVRKSPVSFGGRSAVIKNTPSQTKGEVPKGDYFSNFPATAEPFSEEGFQEELEEFQGLPEIMQNLVVKQLEELGSLKDVRLRDGGINATAVALRLYEIRRRDLGFYKVPRPSFTKQDIDKMLLRMKERPEGFLSSDDEFLRNENLVKAAGGNETELALLCLEYEYWGDKFLGIMETVVDDQEVVAAFEELLEDSVVEQALPPCTRKEGQEPTLKQAQLLLREVLPKAQFTSTSRPVACPGGYIIKGTSRAPNGDALIASIDKQLAKMPTLRDKITVCYLPDFTASDEDDETSDDETSDDVGSILFVGGPNLAREPRRVALSVTSAVGLATCWYLSLYPFLLNPVLAERVDEQLALVDANMAGADLSWLTALSFPLFVTFVTLQFLHEAGHGLMATFNDIKPTFPTFVPSFITGVTSSVTSFKEPPKNLQALFDFSIAGPLFGMLGSMFAIWIGSELSVVGDAAGLDPANFPALPLEILRQSSLGGGIVEAVMGPGVLYIPKAAQGTQATASMTIPLHPIAIAGYISLVVNSLSMLPIGTTDGGRVAMTLFGRLRKQGVGALALLALLVFGIQGSDLFLFYFAFCLAFQQGNEIPCRNEVDELNFPRVLVAIAAYVLAILALVPCQK